VAGQVVLKREEVPTERKVQEKKHKGKKPEFGNPTK